MMCTGIDMATLEPKSPFFDKNLARAAKDDPFFWTALALFGTALVPDLGETEFWEMYKEDPILPSDLAQESAAHISPDNSDEPKISFKLNTGSGKRQIVIETDKPVAWKALNLPRPLATAVAVRHTLSMKDILTRPETIRWTHKFGDNFGESLLYLACLGINPDSLFDEESPVNINMLDGIQGVLQNLSMGELEEVYSELCAIFWEGSTDVNRLNPPLFPGTVEAARTLLDSFGFSLEQTPTHKVEYFYFPRAIFEEVLANDKPSGQKLSKKAKRGRPQAPKQQTQSPIISSIPKSISTRRVVKVTDTAGETSVISGHSREVCRGDQCRGCVINEFCKTV